MSMGREPGEEEKQSSEQSAVQAADDLYAAAIAAARLALINQTDFATLEEIAPENQVVTSDKYQFDVASLFELIQTKPLELLANPYTNQKFSERDKQTILKAVHEYARREGKTVKLLIGNPYPNGDPDYMATMELVRQIQIQEAGNGNAEQSNGSTLAIQEALRLYFSATLEPAAISPAAESSAFGLYGGSRDTYPPFSQTSIQSAISRNLTPPERSIFGASLNFNLGYNFAFQPVGTRVSNFPALQQLVDGRRLALERLIREPSSHEGRGREAENAPSNPRRTIL